MPSYALLHSCYNTSALPSAEAATEKAVLHMIIKQAAARGVCILVDQIHHKDREVQFRKHNGRTATYADILNNLGVVMSIGRSVPLQDFPRQDLVEMFRKGDLRLNLHMATLMDTIAVAFGMVYSNKGPKFIYVQSQLINFSFSVYAPSGASPVLTT